MKYTLTPRPYYYINNQISQAAEGSLSNQPPQATAFVCSEQEIDSMKKKLKKSNRRGEKTRVVEYKH
jgi:hypothetical protein